MTADTQGDRMKRYRAQKGPERLRRCPGCGAVDRSCNYDCSAENAGISGEEYVRADFHREAVDRIKALRDRVRPNDPDPREAAYARGYQAAVADALESLVGGQ